jgi:hypothetical protein
MDFTTALNIFRNSMVADIGARTQAEQQLKQVNIFTIY